MKLPEIQSLFLEGVLGDGADPRLLAQFRPSPRGASAEDLFAVYHDGFRLRMAEFLANDYPVLRQAVGDEIFGEMALAYASAHPSRFRNARWFGAALPEFLANTQPYCEDRFGCGLAAFEAALARAFDAENCAPLDVTSLAATPQADWPRLKFAFAPGIAMVALPPVALAVYEAVQADEEPDIEGIDDATDQPMLVWRKGLDPFYRALDPGEALALSEAVAGKSFGEICALLAFSRPDEETESLTIAAAQYLANWFAEGLIVAMQA